MVHKFKYFSLMVFFAAGLLHAQDESDAIRPFQNEFGPGARAMAMGGAFSALAEDYTAVYWNPAGLAQIRKMEIYGGLSHLSMNNRIGYQGTLTENTNGFTNLNAVGMVFPIPTMRGSMVFAFGYNRINHFDDYSEVIGSPVAAGGKTFDQNEKTTTGGSLNQWSFAGATDLTKNVSVGASLNLLVGNNRTSVSFIEDDPQGAIPNERQLINEFQINPDYTGVNFKMGALFHPANNFRVALTVTTPSVIHAEENSNFAQTFIDAGLNEYDSTDISFRKYKTTSPWKFEVGASYKFRWLTVSGSVDFMDWTQTRFSSNIYDDLGHKIDGQINENLLANYRQATNYHLGAEWIVPQLGAKLMAGYFYQESPFKSSAELVNSNRQFLSGGVSLLLDQQVKLDVAYQHGWWNRSTTDPQLIDEIGNNLFTSEKIRSNRFLISMSYRF